MAWKCKESGDMTASFFKIISTFPTQKKNMVNKAPQDFVGQKTVAKPFPFRWMFLYLMPQFSSFGGGGRNHSLIPILSPKVAPSWNVWPLLTLIHPKKDTTTEEKAQRAGDSTETLVMDHVSDHRLRHGSC